MSESHHEPGSADSSPAAGDSDEVDLRSGLQRLAGLVTEGLRLDEVLQRVASFAVEAIPGADGAGVTLLRSAGAVGQVEAVAASHPFVAEIDEIQYVTLQEGPCITAAREGRTVLSGSLGGDPQWSRFGPRVSRLGVHSALSLPLLLPPHVVGAINVYARAKDTFDDRAASLGEAFARPAAVAVYNAQLLSRALTLTEHLQVAMRNRPIIDQAIGLIRGRRGVTADEAMAMLRSVSQDEHRKLTEVAQQIVDEAIRSASARKAP